MGKSSSNTTTTNTSPNPDAMAAYQNVLSRAGGVANLPFQSYGGQFVAPVNQQQYTGISGLNQYASYAQPFINVAASLATMGSTPLTAADIAQYTNPYIQTVTGATLGDLNTLNTQQQQSLLSNAASQGALGGDRAPIAQAILAGQQAKSEAPTLAGIESQGYTTGTQTALAEQQAEAQGGYAFGNLGNLAQSAGLTGAEAQIQGGTLEQSTSQALDQALYNQFLMEQAYPFQSTGWLAGIDSAIGSQMGGQSQTTGPAPSPWASLLGIGLAGAGILSDERLKEDIEHVGKLNDGQPIYRYRYKGDPTWHIGMMAQEVQKKHPEAVHNAGLGDLKMLDLKAATEDAVDGREDRQFGGSLGMMPYEGGETSFIPQTQLIHGSGPPAPPNTMGAQAQQQQQQNQMTNELLHFAEGPGKGKGAGLFNAFSLPGGSGDYSGLGWDSAPATLGSGVSDSLSGLGGLGDIFSLFARGGGIHVPERPGRDDGGMIDQVFHDAYAPYSETMPTADTSAINFAPSFYDDRVPAGSFTAPAGLADARQALLDRGTLDANQAGIFPGGVPVPARRPDEALAADALSSSYWPTHTPDELAAAGYPSTSAFSANRPSVELPNRYETPAPSTTGGTLANAAPELSSYLYAAPGTKTADNRSGGLLGFLPMTDAARSGLITAGLGMMASRSPFPAVAVGEGGLAGMAAYTGQQHFETQTAQTNKRIDLEAKRLDQQAEFQRRHLDNQTSQIAELNRYRESLIARENFKPIGTTPEGHPAIMDSRTGQTVDAITHQPIDPNTKVSANKTATPDAVLDDKTATALAHQLNQGDTSVLTNLGRGSQGAANVVKVRTLAAQLNEQAGRSGEEQALKRTEFQGLGAAQRTLAQRTVNIEMAGTAAENMMTQVQATSDKINRTNYPALNSILLAGEKQIGDPNVVQFGIALNSFINAYSRAISPTGVPTVSDKDHARELLSTAWSQGQVNSAMQQLKAEIEMERAAPGMVHQRIRDLYTQKTGQPATAADTPAIPTAPAALPPGSQYSPSRNLWRTPDGHMFNSAGQPVQ